MQIDTSRPRQPASLQLVVAVWRSPANICGNPSRRTCVTTFATGLDRRDLELLAPDPTGILDAPTLAFVAELAARFAGPLDELLDRRRQTQARFDAGVRPGFATDT